MGVSEHLDYEKIGLKCGIEIHQQLKTKRKLFCRCPAVLTTREPDFTVLRTFRPVLGEMGVFDKAMLLEFKKKMKVIYQGYNDINCTYELDDTPPFECSDEAINIALLLAKILNMTIVDELKVCRKNYLDGSVPAGFQRTIIVAKDGYYTLANNKKIGIEILCLEEDAARRIEQKGNYITFRLDRLGIPLVEIATAPDITDPNEAKEAAARLGLLLRGTGKVRRGLGVTRQDINVSIAKGERIEIKGVQKLNWIPILVENEAKRQLNLLDLKEKILSREISKEMIEAIDDDGVDLSPIFAKTNVHFIKKGLKNKNLLVGIKIPKLSGLLGLELQPDRRFGTELSDRVRLIAGLSGLIHSDEDLQKYGFADEEIEKVIQNLKMGKDDAFILMLGKKDKIQRAIPVIKERLKEALIGVPPETRRALENGNTEFLRGLHGGSRLYPDTDSRSILISEERIKAIEIPPKPWDIIADMKKKHGLDPKKIEQVILDGCFSILAKIINITNVNPSLILNTLTNTITAIKRDGFDVENITDQHFLDMFKALDEKKLSKEAIEDLLKTICQDPTMTIKHAARKLNISAMKLEDLIKIINETINKNEKLILERKDRAFSPLMGDIMAKARGKIDGKIVARELRKALNEKLKESGA
ncbi:MAG: Glu-tRNA(Gln) amidotransferase subunit GatE [Promethearchaeota archaeon]